MATRRALRPFLAPPSCRRPKCPNVPPRHTPSATQTHPSATSPFPRKSTPSAKLFALSEIPPSAFQNVLARTPQSSWPLSPAEYHAVAQQFADAIHRGANPWAVPFSSDRIPPETLHATACIMRHMRIKPAETFATALWSSASARGHRAATLSLARQLIRSGAYGRVPQLRAVEARYRQLLGGGRDADAMTAEGELLFEQGRYEAAAATLRRALQIGGEFEWRPYCELCLGKALARMGEGEEARRLFARLAEEGGMVEADGELADLLLAGGGGTEGVEQTVYTAARHGRWDLFTRLSERELAGGGGERTDEERRLWALEWARLADVRVAY